MLEDQAAVTEEQAHLACVVDAPVPIHASAAVRGIEAVPERKKRMARQVVVAREARSDRVYQSQGAARLTGQLPTSRVVWWRLTRGSQASATTAQGDLAGRGRRW